MLLEALHCGSYCAPHSLYANRAERDPAERRATLLVGQCRGLDGGRPFSEGNLRLPGEGVQVVDQRCKELQCTRIWTQLCVQFVDVVRDGMSSFLLQCETLCP